MVLATLPGVPNSCTCNYGLYLVEGDNDAFILPDSPSARSLLTQLDRNLVAASRNVEARFSTKHRPWVLSSLFPSLFTGPGITMP